MAEKSVLEKFLKHFARSAANFIPNAIVSFARSAAAMMVMDATVNIAKSARRFIMITVLKLKANGT